MDTCFKLTADVPMRNNIRQMLLQFGQLQQVFVPNFKSTVIYVRYKEASSAQEAKKALLKYPQINKIEDLEDWNLDTFSTPQEDVRGSPISGEQDNDSSSEEEKNEEILQSLSDGIPMHFKYQHSLLGPAPSACLFCYNPAPLYECYRCRQGYCNEKCRDADWEKHVDECKAFLILKPRAPTADPVDSD
ncbi:uncharacterized protein LOC131269513 isoform X2 [Anopheles coustani]|uniref:uncharacterized protein LOC131269513 isoform X2 n=1 Tax=Anopheles coustani TaxID=139045 RepID=UPI00265871F0|nr:uncharacterized protein LOC131269513 isoform X2 [Anopheles coustani]